MKCTIICCLLICATGASLSSAQESVPTSANKKPAGHSADAAESLAAIRAQSEAFVAAFNRQDADAVAAFWTQDGEYVDDAGRRFVGREAIAQGYAEFFAQGGEHEMHLMIDSLRMLSDDAAIEDGRAVVDPAPAGAPGVSKYTVVHVRVDGEWLMASVRDTWMETPSEYHNIADLEWLIGTWTAEDEGVTTESVCRWVAEKSFVQRSYTITNFDGIQTSGVQIIGWDPVDGHVQSWNFSPDGGHAVGVWTPRPGGWSAEMQGVTGDGLLTTSVNLLTRLDDNAYVWQSVQRTLGESVLPDTDEVVLKRQSASR